LIGVTGDFGKAKVKTLAPQLLSLLKKQGLETELFRIPSKKLNSKKFSLICVVGGDGSLLRVVRELKKPVPVIGVAAGTRSYLMQINPGRLKQAVRKIAKKKYKVEKRTRLSAKLSGKKIPPALNELLVVPKESGSLIRLAVKAGRSNYEIAGDGLIIATSTGSTGHAFSAGCKRLKHGCRKIAVVPSNPLERKQKPFTVSKNAEISVKPISSGKKMEVVVDGRIRFPLTGKLSISKGKDALVARL